MTDLLDFTGLRQKYESAVQREKLTLENFVKLVQMDQSGLTSTLLKRFKMSCGDFTEMVIAYEKHALDGQILEKTCQVKQRLTEARAHANQDKTSEHQVSNTKSSDPFQTPA